MKVAARPGLLLPLLDGRPTSPRKNTGAEMKVRLVIIVTRSSTVRRLIAEMMPTGIAIASQITTEPTTSQTVAGRRSKMIVLTGVLDWKMSTPRLNGPVPPL